MYAIDSTQHSPLIGFAYDGFPIYGAYGYANTDGTGGIVRIKSSYQLKTTRGTGNVPSQTTWPLGTFREDYEYIVSTGEDHLDEHNGRLCVTPEYPDGTYAYFATVDENWNSTYPYVVGPTFYGVSENRKVNIISEITTVYNGTSGLSETRFGNLNISIFPNPTKDVLNISLMENASLSAVRISILDATGKLIYIENASGVNVHSVNVSEYESGLYFIRIEVDGERIQSRFSVVH